MSENKFSSNDKVFAKIKGYPAWPAQVLNYNAKTKKYEVKFYGTGETGAIKEDSLFYYISNKSKYGTVSKRKDFMEAVTEIEKDIQAAGTDGYQDHQLDELLETKPSPATNLKKKFADYSGPSGKIKKSKRKSSGSEASNNQERSTTIIKKRAEMLKDELDYKVDRWDMPQVSRSGRKIKTKRFSSDEETIPKKPRKLTKSTSQRPPSPPTPEETLEEKERSPKRAETPIESDKEDDTLSHKVNSSAVPDDALEDVDSKSSDTLSFENSERKTTPEPPATDTGNSNETVLSMASLQIKTATPSPVEYKVISQRDLEIFVKYYTKVAEKPEIFKKREPENLDPPHCTANQVLLATIGSSEVTVGIFYNSVDQTECVNEYDRAKRECAEAERILKYKEDLETEKLTFANDSHEYVVITELSMQCERQLFPTAHERRVSKCPWLKVESKLLEHDCLVREALTIQKEDVSLGLEVVENMSQIEVKPVMLLKYPHILELVKKLTTYGLHENQMTIRSEDKDVFEAGTEKIREIATEIFRNYKEIMSALIDEDEDDRFWDRFVNKYEDFHNRITKLKQDNFYFLTSDLDSREYIIDEILNEEDDDKGSAIGSDQRSLVMSPISMASEPFDSDPEV